MARLPLFEKDGDYEAFERVVVEAAAGHPTRILGYCLMPNHWHFVLWPRAEGELTAFLRWLTHTYTRNAGMLTIIPPLHMRRRQRGRSQSKKSFSESRRFCPA